LLFVGGVFSGGNGAGEGTVGAGETTGVGCEGAGFATVFEGTAVPVWVLGAADGVEALGAGLKSEGPKELVDGDSAAGGAAGTGLDHGEDGDPTLLIDEGTAVPLTAAPLPRP